MLMLTMISSGCLCEVDGATDEQSIWWRHKRNGFRSYVLTKTVGHSQVYHEIVLSRLTHFVRRRRTIFASTFRVHSLDGAIVSVTAQCLCIGVRGLDVDRHLAQEEPYTQKPGRLNQSLPPRKCSRLASDISQGTTVYSGGSGPAADPSD